MNNCSMSNETLKAQKKPRNSPTILLARKWHGTARAPPRYNKRVPSNLERQYKALQKRHKGLTLCRVSRRGRGCGYRRARRGEPGDESTQRRGGDEEADEEAPDEADDGAKKRRGRRRASAIGGFTTPGAR